MLGFGKKKSKVQKQDSVSEKNLAKVATNRIMVRVYRSLGGNIRNLKATYFAEEKKDMFGELVSENQDAGHLEDVDFSMDSLYSDLQILLNFGDKTKEQKLEILDKKIKKQKRLLYFLDRLLGLNAIYNYQDEIAQLRNLNILRNHVNNIDQNGAYFTIEKDGIRCYSFEYINGILVPIWHGSDTYSCSPDHTRRVKNKIVTDLKFAQEIEQYKMSPKIMNTALILLAISVMVLFGAVYGWWHVSQMYKNYELELGEGQAVCQDVAMQCAQNTAIINKEYGNLVIEALNEKRKLIELQNTTNNPAVTEIVPEPLTP